MQSMRSLPGGSLWFSPMDRRLRPSLGVGILAPPLSRHSVAVCAGEPKAGKGRAKKDKSPYSATVRLPQTSFNLRANSVQREPEIQKLWKEQQVYEKLSTENPGDNYTLHDGPPYANGDLHIGHALNKVLKDIIIKHQLLTGAKAKYVPGWDTHGLPIELKVLQAMNDDQRAALTPLKLRYKARDFALKTVKAQLAAFQRYGVWGEWDDPYVTLRPSFEAAQLGVFGQMFLKGHIYRGRKPVNWSPSSGTALAEAELEYPPDHVSRSIYVAMPVMAAPEGAPEAVTAALAGDGLSVAVWTTTPWTIPANLAVGVNERLSYSVVDQGAGLPQLLVATDLIDTLEEKWDKPLKEVGTVTGAQLDGVTYRHPLLERESPVVIGGDYITTDSGTGLVHTAPGHGQEDYLVGQKYGLPLLSPVDDQGVFTSEAGPFQGLPVLGEGNTAVIQALEEAGALLLAEDYPHKYPYDWRTKEPTIFRATSQWFASVEGFRGQALEAIQGVKWTPAAGENRIRGMTEGRSDWCISRQRKWGVPIPAFYDRDSGEPLMTEETIQHVQAIIAEKGTDAWYQMDEADLLPPSYADTAHLYIKGEDTMDVWFDSGSSWAAVLRDTPGLSYPADLYLEGSDQHRGWFQSSLLTSVAANGIAPYKQVLTHGFVLDERGFKMSKSIGNTVDPRDVIEGGKNQKKEPGLGADVLRLWVASVDYSSDVSIGDSILKQTAEVYRKTRGTLRFLSGNLHDFRPQKHAVPHSELPAVDRHVLTAYAALLEECDAAFAAFQFFKATQAVQKFINNDLSAFYLDAAKDRLYVAGEASFTRRSCQTVLHTLLHGLLGLLAPVTPHMAEDAYQCLPDTDGETSIFQAGWPTADDAWTSAESVANDRVLGIVRGVRDEANKVMDTARSAKFIGAPLECRLKVHIGDEGAREALAALQASDNDVDGLRFAFIVSQCDLVDDPAEAEAGDFTTSSPVPGAGQVTVGVFKAEGSKCARCWNYSTHVGDSEEHPEICERCLPVIKEMGFELPQPATV